MDDDFDGALEDVQPNAASDDDGELSYRFCCLIIN